MGLFYKAYSHLLMEGLEWGVEKGKAKIRRDQREYNKTHRPLTFYDGYSKLDSIFKRKNDIEESELLLNDIYDEYDL